MLLTREAFKRLCHARGMLLEVEEERAPSVRRVAEEVAISPFHFIRQFEAVFGVTPHQLRTRVRIERAKELLATHELSVTEICMEVGFSSLGSFSELFTRRVGISPSAYRRRIRLMVQVPERIVQMLMPGCLSLMSMLPANAFRNFREAAPRRVP